MNFTTKVSIFANLNILLQILKVEHKSFPMMYHVNYCEASYCGLFIKENVQLSNINQCSNSGSSVLGRCCPRSSRVEEWERSDGLTFSFQCLS